MENGGHEGDHSIPAHQYSLRAPSPPSIHIPTLSDQRIILPDYDAVATEQITDDDLRAIIQVQHVAVEAANDWKYESRRRAQLILPFLYLGPFSAARDKDFLCEEKITMLLVVRNTRSAQAHLLSGDRVAAEIGIVSAAVDVDGNQELIAAFPKAINIINNHLLALYRQQVATAHQTSQASSAVDQSQLKKGKVLVFCETGNERSACVVVAYLLSMYGLGLIQAVQFVQSQRFCMALDDPLKRLLQSYESIVLAQRHVQRTGQLARTISSSRTSNPDLWRKRNRDEIEDETAVAEDHTMRETDDARFQDRGHFMPFVDR